jgi:hypothetical protein
VRAGLMALRLPGAAPTVGPVGSPRWHGGACPAGAARGPPPPRCLARGRAIIAALLRAAVRGIAGCRCCSSSARARHRLVPAATYSLESLAAGPSRC